MTKKSTETKKRPEISSLRRLALQVRAILDAYEERASKDGGEGGLTAAITEADKVLVELGFGSLVGIPKQVATLTAELETAKEANDWKLVAQIATALDRVRLGKSPVKLAAPAKEKAPRKPRTPKTNEPGKCVTCGNEEGDPSHDQKSDNFHIFRTEIKKKGDKSDG